MDFTINKIDLLAAIDKCSVAVPRDHQQVAFSIMRVETKKKTVRFAAVGEVCTVDTVVEGQVKTPGFFTVRPKHLRDLAASMPDGRIQCLLKGTRVTVKSLVSSRKASFESHTTELFTIEDPGKEAPWVEVNAKELERGLRIVRPSATWEDRPDPTVSLLIPTERGVDVFGSNGYMVALVETSLRIDGVPPIQLPEEVVDVLFQMSGDDENVRIFSNERRVYLENCDTLVTSALPANYVFLTNHVHAIAHMKDTDRVAGATFNPALLLQGVKSVLSAAGFASADEKKVGMSIHLKIGTSVQVRLALGDADAQDEFDVVEAGTEMEFTVSSAHLLKLLSGLSGVDIVKVYQSDNKIILQSQGILCCMAEQRK